MSNGKGLTVLNENIFAHVELFILEEVVHRFQGRLEEKFQTYFKRDTECLNQNIWMISCMLLSCCCVVFPGGLSRTEVVAVFVLLL